MEKLFQIYQYDGLFVYYYKIYDYTDISVTLLIFPFFQFARALQWINNVIFLECFHNTLVLYQQYTLSDYLHPKLIMDNEQNNTLCKNKYCYLPRMIFDLCGTTLYRKVFIFALLYLRWTFLFLLDYLLKIWFDV